MRSSLDDSVSPTSREGIALLIEDDAGISLCAKAVFRHGYKLAALDYGKIRNVPQIGKTAAGFDPGCMAEKVYASVIHSPALRNNGFVRYELAGDECDTPRGWSTG